MHYVSLILDFAIPIGAALFTYKWYREKNPETGWYTLVMLALLAGNSWDYIEPTLNLGTQMTKIINVTENVYALGILVAFGYILYIFRNRKVTFKKEESLKKFSQGTGKTPKFLSIDPKYKNFPDKQKYPYLLLLHIHFKNKNADGLPDGDEAISNLDNFEDTLLEQIRAVCNLCFIGRMTTNGIRYVICQIDDDTRVTELFQSMKDTKNSGIYFYTSLEKDEDWKWVSKVFKGLKI